MFRHSVNQPAENLICRVPPMDGFPACEPAAQALAVGDPSTTRRHSLRFAADKTDGLGVNSMNSCRIRSPILFRWNTAHEEIRLT